MRSMERIADAIPISSAVKEHWAKIGYKPSDREWLIMLWNAEAPTLEETLDLMKAVQDEVEPELARDIGALLDDYASRVAAIADDSDGSCVYTLSGFFEGTTDEEELYCISRKYEVVRSLALAAKGYRRIQKYQLLDDAQAFDPEEDYEVGFLNMEGGKMTSVWTRQRDVSIFRMYGEDDGPESVFERYFEIPHPFQSLDVVRLAGDEKNELGIVREFLSKERYEELRRNRVFDPSYLDNDLTVEWLYEDGEFGHDHVNPLKLEYASLGKDKESEVIDVALSLLNGRTTLEVFQIYCKELAEENKRKKL